MAQCRRKTQYFPKWCLRFFSIFLVFIIFHFFDFFPLFVCFGSLEGFQERSLRERGSRKTDVSFWFYSESEKEVWCGGL